MTVGVSPGDDDEQVRLTVTDTGVGIEADECSKVFERFYRSRSATDGAVQGSGLGLAIAKVMVEAQAGSIAVTSLPGTGSTFTVCLVAVPEHHPSSAPPPADTGEE